MTAPALFTADTVTWRQSTQGGVLRLYLPGGAEVRFESPKPDFLLTAVCQRCEARSRAGFRHDNPDDQREFRAFLATHAGAACPRPATTPKRSRSR